METVLKRSNGLRLGKLVTECDRLEIALDRGSFFQVDGNKRGMTLHCSKGSLWLTQEGDPKDYLLTPGEDFVIKRRGKILVQGQPEGRVKIHPEPCGRGQA